MLESRLQQELYSLNSYHLDKYEQMEAQKDMELGQLLQAHSLLEQENKNLHGQVIEAKSEATQHQDDLKKLQEAQEGLIEENKTLAQ